MKKIWIVLGIIIWFLIFILTIQKKSITKGSDTKIAYWNIDSNILDKKSFSLVETMSKDCAANNCICPGTYGDFEIILEANNLRCKYFL